MLEVKENIELNKYQEEIINEKYKLIVVIVNYLKHNYKISDNDLVILIKYIIEYQTKGIVNECLQNIDWINLNLESSIEEFNINVDEIIKDNYFEFLILDNLFVEDKEYKNKHYYEKFEEEKKRGKTFNKSDLTKDILFELSIVENKTDSMIGNIFNLSKSQVKYVRTKYNLENMFLKQLINNSKDFIKRMKEEISFKHQNSLLVQYIYFHSLELHCKSNGYKLENLYSYLEERKRDNFKHYTFIVNKSKTKKKTTTKKYNSNGRKINQKEAYISKLKSGKKGEELALVYEQKRLTELGLSDLANKVKLITKTSNENITFDGTGYDIISYNKNREKIYIEVKSSKTNFSNQIKFNISAKELKLINGEIEGFDKDHCFIYYIHNIYDDIREASIEIIDYKKIKEYQVEPINYFVHE